METQEPGEARTGLWSVRAAGVAGIVFSVLIVSALALLRDSPPENALDATSWYASAHDRIQIAVYLIPFSGIAFLWFLAVVRRRIGRAEDQFFATVFLATGLLFTAMLFVAGAAASAMLAASVTAGQVGDAAVIIVGRSLAQTTFYVFGIKMAAAFMLVTSSIGLRSHVLPRWFGLVGIAGGLVMLLSVGFLEGIAVVFPAWTFVVSILLLRLPAEAWASA